MAEFNIYKEHNLETLKRMPDNSLDAVVTDAPYGLGKEPDPTTLIKAWIDIGYLKIEGKGFMGKEWDAFVPQPVFWKEVYRVLKPGGYVLCFFGTRTYDWGTLAIRLAGFEIRDCIQWIYGSGFPKSLDVSKAIDNQKGLIRDVIGTLPAGTGPLQNGHANKGGGGGFISEERSPEIKITVPNCEEAKIWKGYGTALKPAYEPICVARKPLDGTVCDNALNHKCGAINLDGCRVPFASVVDKQSAIFGTGNNINGGNYGNGTKLSGRVNILPNDSGRFPANVIFDEKAAVILDQQTGELTSGKPIGIRKAINNIYGQYKPGGEITGYGDTGGASRFFYCAKSSPSDRNYGMGIPVQKFSHGSMPHDYEKGVEGGNTHPTVKPISLMRYLVRLVKTPFSTCTIADFFLGSGTTGIACMLEGINFIGSEDVEESYDIAERRISFAKAEYLKEQTKPKQTKLF